ncbi:hypothetical protein ElyMa_006322200 [Elysia marginata]|uniref:Uncharacterized protein n=1 Tax=Elysia marginata TaxID=1093978 RepID=A0AAV4HL35_9GAST|nr:hypothetical protein ElyMa_006322200 [Elysia marginata]
MRGLPVQLYQIVLAIYSSSSAKENFAYHSIYEGIGEFLRKKTLLFISEQDYFYHPSDYFLPLNTKPYWTKPHTKKKKKNQQQTKEEKQQQQNKQLNDKVTSSMTYFDPCKNTTKDVTELCSTNYFAASYIDKPGPNKLGDLACP